MTLSRPAILAEIARFEILHLVRRPMLWLCLLTIAALSIAFASAAGLGGGTAVSKINSPYMLANLYAFEPVIAGFMIALIMGDGGLRDRSANLHEIIGATPTPHWLLVAGRYLGAVLVTLFVFIVGALAFEIACRAWWINQAIVGPVQLGAHVRAFLTLTLPTILILGALFAAIATATRSLTVTMLGFLALVVLFFSTAGLRASPFYMELGALIDPTGLRAFQYVTRYWTIAEREVRPLLLEKTLSTHRALWLAIAWGMLGFIAVSRSSVAGMVRRKRVVPVEVAEHVVGARMLTTAPRPTRSNIYRPKIEPFVASGAWEQLRARTGLELMRLLKSWTWAITLALFGGLLVLVLTFKGGEDIPVVPVTASLLPLLAGACAIPALLMAIIFGGDLVWRERQCNIAEIIDATPTPGAIHIAAKLAAVGLLIYALIALTTGVGISYQLARKSPNIDWSFYGYTLFVELGLTLLMYAVLAMLVHVLIGNRFLGHISMILLVAAISSMTFLRVDQPLLQFAEVPTVTLSEMAGFGHFLAPALWHLAYWCAVTLVLAVAAHLFWPRGPVISFADRLTQAQREFAGPARWIGIGGFATAAVIGCTIYVSTRVLNEHMSPAQTEAFQVQVEKDSQPFLALATPEIVDIDLAVDLEPERQAFASAGRITLLNRTGAPISEIHIGMLDDLTVNSLELPDAVMVRKRACCHDYVARLSRPMMPNEKRELTFKARSAPKGVIQAKQLHGIRANGTFLYAHDLSPIIGIDRREFLADERRRSAFGLPPLNDFPVSGDRSPYRRNYISSSGFTRFAITVSTNADQTAVAPGYLTREWQDGGRRFFRYETTEPILNFWSLLSAKYAVAKDNWNDVELAVFHHPQHATHTARMMDAMKASLEYCSREFGPYQHRQLRILEFPYGNFAQAFANTIPMSEIGGFIADPTALEGFDSVSYVTSHETAHQWFAHQIVSADIPGATFLSETLAEYSALMIMEKSVGVERMRAYVKRNVDKYLEARGDSGRERPLIHVKTSQPHIAYQKGGHAMYALRLAIGEEKVNGALKEFIAKFRFRSDPYPTSADLLAELKAAAGPNHEGLVGDLFERITLWDIKAASAETTQRADGIWDTTIIVMSNKVTADELGNETAAPLDEDVEIGIYLSDPRERIWSTKVLKLEQHRIRTERTAITITSQTQPTWAGANAGLALMQRDRTKTAVSVTRE
jgi:ABC-2 type transport system permease protein